MHMIDEMRRKVVMIDYWSVCDKTGNPIGHGLKVGNEYYGYIKEKCAVVHYVNEGVLKYIDNIHKKSFKKSLSYGAGRLKRIFTNFACINEVIHNEKEAVIWFYAPDIYLYLFLLGIHKGKRRFVVNVFDLYSENFIKNMIIKYALKKIDVAFVTNRILKGKVLNSVLVPDYAYRKSYYEKYSGQQRKKRVICLGTMNEEKQLEEAVDVFLKNGYSFTIIGQFSSDERFKKLYEKKSDNITIENRYAGEEEYYKLLAESKFCLLPYDPKLYNQRTSGVLQECIFCGTIPITHESILKFVHIEGIGYKDIHELAYIDFDLLETETIERINKKELIDFYDYISVKNKVLETITKLK